MRKTRIWIQAFRLRTLPLALSTALMGSFLAGSYGKFRWTVFLLSSLTTIFLQILSNLANDYGDAVNGMDNKNRQGPARVTQTGMVTHKEIKFAIVLFLVLSLISGISLIFVGLSNVSTWVIIAFLLSGLTAIAAAIKYTVGKKPYGYIGLGDLFVFVYFGILGVCGTFYLHTNTFMWETLLPATTIGFLSVGVLNLNNLRDIVSDEMAGKKTLVVRLGSYKAKIYHIFLIFFSLFAGLIYTFQHFNSYFQLAFLLTSPLLITNVIVVLRNDVPVELNKELKKLSITTFIYTLTFGVGLLL